MTDFLLHLEEHHVPEIDPCTTVLDYLRIELGLYGTKEGCASGDCGACTVVVGELKDGDLHYRTLNACIMLLPTLHGKQLITVEHVGSDTNLHPIQKAMVNNHGSQCGFCTPGIVMSLFGLSRQTSNPSRNQITTALSGNLCRCTGYIPIITAAEQALNNAAPDRFDENTVETIRALEEINKSPKVEIHTDNNHYFAPSTVDELAELYKKFPHAYLLAGGTDLALEITQALKNLSPIIYIGNINELKCVDEDAEQITIGAGVPLLDCEPIIAQHFPDFSEVLRRFGSVQIRNAGTIGGNLANASPIGDTPPALLALNAEISLRKARQNRTVSAAEFFVDYRHTIMDEGEFIEKISLPKLLPQQVFKMYKVSKRFEDDISAVCGAFCLGIDKGIVSYAKIAYGGMADIPKRAMLCEQALYKRPWIIETVEAACAALAGDFQPITDVRASGQYRLTVAQNLLKKYFFESESTEQIGVVNYA